MDNFAEERNMDPLLPETWYKFSYRDFRSMKVILYIVVLYFLLLALYTVFSFFTLFLTSINFVSREDEIYYKSSKVISTR